VKVRSICLRKKESQMPEFTNNISNILAKYPTLSLDEEKILNEWIKEDDNREIFEALTNNESRIALLERYDQMKQEEHQKWEKFETLLNSTTQQAKTVWWNRWQTYMAAASIILMVFIGFKWLAKKDSGIKTETPVVAVPKNDIAPGQFKARLILADGSVVVLDTISDSKLVQQGGTNVYTRKGQLVYEQKGKHTEVLYNTLTTAKGETYGMVLSDGSKVWLNSQSSLRYPVAFTGDERRVEITGEAYFEVATQRKLPFVVSLNGMEVEVLGTIFNINSYTDEDAVKTTLLEGKVKVSNGGSLTMLMTGQQAILNKQTQKLDKLENVDVEEAVAWRFGYFQFHDADLKTVLRQIARWYDVDVEYKGDIPLRKFEGKIPRNSNLSQVLAVLETNKVRFAIKGKKIIVAP
jgi:transmembrane sensor